MAQSEKAKLNTPATRPKLSPGEDAFASAPTDALGAPTSVWPGFPTMPAALGEAREPSYPWEFWISLFPAAPLFGVKWAFADAHQALFATNPVFASNPLLSENPLFAAFASVMATQGGSGGGAQRSLSSDAVKLSSVRLASPRPDASPTPSLAQREQSLLQSAGSDIVRRPSVSAALKATGVSKAKTAEPSPAPKTAKPPLRSLKGRSGETAALNSAASAPKSKPASKAGAKAAKAPKAGKTSKTPMPKAVSKAAKAPKTPKGMSRIPGVPFAIYEAPPASADDLTRIKGVGEKLAAILNDRGIYKLEQVATFNKTAYAWLDETLHAFKGRAERDDWAGQAKALLKKK